ncbi:MAG: ATP-binding protein [Mariprofundus sp.]|nr:ATP-binding protein [Mariprofundus sp.]
MSIFWKLFFTLTTTLVLTASASSWLSSRWLQQDQAIEVRLNSLKNMAVTAVNLYELETPAHYHHWLRESMHKQHIRGALIDQQGRSVSHRPLPLELQPLAKQVIKKRKQLKVIRPPLLAIALPVQVNARVYYWLAASRLSPGKMRQDHKQIWLMQLAMILLAIAIVSGLLSRMITRPIRILQQTSKQLGQGELSIKTPEKLSTRKDELGALAISFDTMSLQLAALIHSHKQLLRDISHELRSPLARLQVALELARNASAGKADSELDRIGREAERLNELIGEVLTLARFEQGGVKSNMQVLQLDQLLTAIVTDAAFEAEAIKKEILYDKPEHCSVRGDYSWLNRALDNVIRNSIHHSSVGSCVEVHLIVYKGRAVITIRDHGDGVEETQLIRLFDPFFRASSAREHDGSGYGLGLAIAKRAVEMHAGDITACNHRSGGLEVTITLPLISTRS